MGWERKRGKLTEFNRLLRGATDTSFTVQHGDLSVLPAVRYVITLDSDTQLPIECGPQADRDAVASAEPAALRSRTCNVSPRATASCSRGSRSASSAPTGPPFAKVFCRARRHRSLHDRGVGRVSGSLSRGQLRRQGHLRRRRVRGGAGGTRAGQRAAQPRPVRRVRTRAPALCTDIHLVDDYPSHYLTFAARLHRWVRGDWQIARWLWRTVPDANGQTVPNTLPIIARWKILDNLRRSLMPPAHRRAAGRGLDGASQARRRSGRRWRCWCWPFRPTSRSVDRIGEPRRGRAVARAPARRDATTSSRACARRRSRSSCSPTRAS